MRSTTEKNNLKTAFLFMLLTVFISCNTTLKANDINATDLDNFEINENTGIAFISGKAENEVEPTETPLEVPQIIQNNFFSYPLQTQTITSYFGNRRDPISGIRRLHDGIDFSAPVGETVMAAMDGIVSVAVYHREHGNYIVIDHSNGYKTLYSHLSSFSVKQGDTVERGQKIGESGNTGNSTGPHLHFGVYDTDDTPINPLELLKNED